MSVQKLIDAQAELAGELRDLDPRYKLMIARMALASMPERSDVGGLASEALEIVEMALRLMDGSSEAETLTE